MCRTTDFLPYFRNRKNIVQETEFVQLINIILILLVIV